MSTPIITVEHLSKRYHLGQIGATTLRDSAQRLYHRLCGQNPDAHLGKVSSNTQVSSLIPQPSSLPASSDSGIKFQPSALLSSPDDLWALKDVSFEVQPGEVLGIIGRNGAGKSTLLKILSRITEPTSGRAILRGRVASLLEVGTGFHPELTGRENIFLNGAILGMKEAEIARKFDEIVAFSEVERFIDTPVKRYSSGMYVRLAFAVAAHLEPEILLVDEVLAVGDAEFQKKCIGKMSDVSKAGRTVLFVSHNMGAIRELCAMAIFIDKGFLVERGPVDHIIRKYQKVEGFERLVYVNPISSQKPNITGAEILREKAETAGGRIDEPVIIKVYLHTGGFRDLVVSVLVNRDDGMIVHHSSDEFCSEGGLGSASTRLCEIPPYALAPGRYTVSLYLGARNRELYQVETDVLCVDVIFCGWLSDRTTDQQWKGVCGPGLLKWHMSLQEKSGLCRD